MDVSKIGGTAGVPGSGRQTHRTGKESFGKILNKTMGEVQGANSNQQAPACATPTAPLHVAQVSAVDNGSILNHAYKVLDLMDNYARALGDPKRTLKSIEPMLQQIQDEVNRLPVDASQNDGGLGTVVNDIAVTANVEAIKFHRGDYVS